MISLAEIHRSGDYLTHEKLWIHSLKSDSVHYRNGYFLFDEGRWRGIDWTDVRGQSLSGKTLIIGHSDDDVSLELAQEVLSTANPTRLFATNLTAEAALLAETEDMPLGIPNDERHSKTHIIQADDSLLRKAWRKSVAPSSFGDTVLYANFSVRNNISVRKPALEQVRKLPGARLGTFALSKKGRLSDLCAMRESGIVVCPRGAGMDTHRFWECLLVGAIPLVLETDHSARLATKWELPVITVKDWSESGDLKNMKEQWESIQDRVWNFETLSSAYWIRFITS